MAVYKETGTNGNLKVGNENILKVKFNRLWTNITLYYTMIDNQRWQYCLTVRVHSVFNHGTIHYGPYSLLLL